MGPPAPTRSGREARGQRTFLLSRRECNGPEAACSRLAPVRGAKGVIYYEREVAGRRIKLSTKATDWEDAASFRDLYEARKGLARGVPIAEAPRFSDFAKRYLEEDTGRLAWTTRRDRESHLRQGGPLEGFFGHHPLDEITPVMLRAWWAQEVEAPRVRSGGEEPRAPSTKTGRSYLDTLAAMLGYAQDLGGAAPAPSRGGQKRP
jgi:hypothetical protein